MKLKNTLCLMLVLAALLGSVAAQSAALTGVRLAAAPPAPCTPGTAIALTATPIGGTNVEYLFRAGYQDQAGWHWQVFRPYNTASSATYIPAQAAVFTLVVLAREVGSSQSYQAYAALQYRVVAPITGVALATDVPSPQLPGTRVILTATSTGGGTVEYRFRVSYALGGQWYFQELRGYGLEPQCAWTPNQAREYRLIVLARERGSTVAYAAMAVQPFTITASQPAPIAFISTRDGNQEIYAMNPDGTNLRRLTFTTAREDELSYSPDGRQIAFISDRDGNYEVYVMNADGTGQRRLTNNTRQDWGPTFSPDGRKIVYFETVNGSDEIFIMNADGSNIRRLTNNSSFDVLPIFTPDGSKIVFNSNRFGNYDIFIMNPDGSGQTRLTKTTQSDWYHAISPDGQQIAFTSGDRLEIMNLDGSNRRRLTSPTGYQDRRPTFSPDGLRIAFASTRDGQGEIYAMNLDGSNIRRLTINPAKDYYPWWSPR